jgi:hypothetical protein
MRTIHFFALVCMMLTGCSIRVVHNDHERAAFNAAARDKTCKVELKNQWPVDFRHITADSQYVTGTDERGKFYRFRLDSVKTISFVMNRGQTGVISALTIFGVCALIGITSDNSKDLIASPAEMAFGAGMVLAPLGFLIGYLAGEQVIYTFE